jgi:hypothetical protein
MSPYTIVQCVLDTDAGKQLGAKTLKRNLTSKEQHILDTNARKQLS